MRTGEILLRLGAGIELGTVIGFGRARRAGVNDESCRCGNEGSLWLPR